MEILYFSFLFVGCMVFAYISGKGLEWASPRVFEQGHSAIEFLIAGPTMIVSFIVLVGCTFVCFASSWGIIKICFIC